MKFQKLIKTKMLKTFLAFKLTDTVFVILINIKMPMVVGTLSFMSMIFILSIVEHEKRFITSGGAWSYQLLQRYLFSSKKL